MSYDATKAEQLRLLKTLELFPQTTPGTAYGEDAAATIARLELECERLRKDNQCRQEADYSRVNELVAVTAELTRLRADVEAWLRANRDAPLVSLEELEDIIGSEK